jgi:hypothetical protein
LQRTDAMRVTGTSKPVSGSSLFLIGRISHA